MTIFERYAGLKTSQDAKGWRWYGTEEQPWLYPSVSTIQKETIPNRGLEEYYKNNTSKKIAENLERAGTFGTDAHTYFEQIIQTRALDGGIPETHRPHCEAFLAWVLKHDVKPIQQEFVVVSERYGYAGRVDALAEVDGEVELLDWKTGNEYSDAWASQCGAYQLALTEMLGQADDSIGIRVLQIKRADATLKEFKFQHLGFIQDSFLLCLDRFKRAPNFNYLKKLGWKWVMEKAMIRNQLGGQNGSV